MQWSNLKISYRLGIGFLVVILSMVLVTALGVVRVQQISTRLSTINDLNSVKQRYAINFRGSVHDRAINLRDVVLAPTPTAADPDVANIEKLAAKYSDSAAKMDAMFTDGAAVNAKEKAALASIKEIEQKTLPLIDQVISLRKAGDESKALELLMQQAKPAFIEWLAAINVLIDLEEAMNHAESTQARSIADGFLKTMMLLCLLAIALAVAVGWQITRTITRPLAEVVVVLSAVAGGDLTQRLNVTSADEVGQMGVSMNTALAAIGSLMTGVANNVKVLTSTSERLSTMTNRIATGAEESSAQAELVADAAGGVSLNVQTVATGAQEMGSSIREIEVNTRGAATVTAKAIAAMEASTATVSQLGESSRMIGDVVKTISSLAEQTNLLALNATIEAARAGDMGKGFAVVAGEVKDLAQQTAQATEQITARIGAIQSSSASAAAAIGEIAHVITQIGDYTTTIASAVEEQTATTGEMSRSVAEAATSSGDVARTVSGVAEVANATADG
ncbi:MAG TPA: methyl-accepting chemotaxis protein, partial [Kineosporiaceae bacterium]|nr:methyl-accepting chemotaxis protein [Kineosporiaceae bacterium]